MTQEIEQMMGRGEWETAQTRCSELIASHPTNARLHGYLGLCLFRLQQYEEATRSFRLALTLDEKFWEAALKLAQCFDRMMKYPEALEAARVAHRLRPSDPTINVLINGLERQASDPITGGGWEKNAVRHNVSLASE